MHSVTCNLCRLSMPESDGCNEWNPQNTQEQREWNRNLSDKKCSDCGALPGKMHHVHCDTWVCIDCGGLSKDCHCGEHAGSADE